MTDAEREANGDLQVDRRALDGIAEVAERYREAWGVPGVAVAVVGEDGLLFCQGFGARSLAPFEAVDGDTLFAVGSCTKAFTTGAIAALAAGGALAWDRPVRELLPGFALFDPTASEHITLRDLALHRSGLPRHELVWYDSPASQAEIVAALPYLEPSALFRSEMQYSNLMYMVAGHAAGAAAGSSWGEVVRERLFGPLAMTRSRTHGTDIEAADNRAHPYRRTATGQLEETTLYPNREDRPSGSIWSSARDMSLWIAGHIRQAGGSGTGFLPAAQAAELYTPQILSRPPLPTPGTPVVAYGLGWFIAPYRGHLRIHHGGGVRGYLSEVSFLPEERIGVVVLTNSDGHQLSPSLTNAVYDRLLGLEERDWVGAFRRTVDQTLALAGAVVDPAGATLAADLSPAAAAGTYRHPAYGQLTVEVQGDGIAMNLHGIPLEVRPDAEGRLRASGQSVDAYVALRPGSGDAAQAVAMRLEPHPAVSPITFTRTA
jgi:CubicO group peptidase (beta-lactamase class C family)